MSKSSGFKVIYRTWKNRILPMLELSGWTSYEDDNGTTFMFHESLNYRFEYRYYGNSAPVWLGELEVRA